MEIFLLAIILIAIAIAGIAIKMFVKRGGEFTRTCHNSFDPVTGKAAKCTCRKNAPEECDNVENVEEKEQD